MSLETKLIAALIQQNERLIEECERLQQRWEDLHDDTAEESARHREQIDLLQRTQPVLR